MEEMTVPLDIRNDIRSMDADGVSRSEIARRLHVSRNTVSKYADMEDMSPVAPVRRARERPGLEGNGPWIEKVLDEDLSAPRKQRHTAKRIYDRLVEERGFTGSYSTVRRFVAEFRRERSSGAGEGFDLCQDFGHGIERNHAAIGIASGLGSGRSKKASLGSVRSKKSAMASAGTL